MSTSFFLQIKELLFQRGISMEAFSHLAGMTLPELTELLADEHDVSGATLDRIATRLRAEWVLLPSEHSTAVRRFLEANGLEPDYAAPSAAELYLRTLSKSSSSGDDE